MAQEQQSHLDEQFEIIGAFWQPATPRDHFSGTVKADDSGIRFTKTARYTTSRENVFQSVGQMFFDEKTKEEFPVLHGFTEKGQSTLLNVSREQEIGRSDASTGQAITAPRYRASACVVGMHIGGMKDKSLASATYHLKGFADWLRIGPAEEWTENRVVLTVPAEPKDLLVFKLPEIGEVTIFLADELRSEDEATRVLRKLPLVRITPSEPANLEHYLRLGNRLENFFSLLTGGSCTFNRLFVNGNAEESAYVVIHRRRHKPSFDMRDGVFLSFEQLEQGLSRWLTMPKSFERVESLALVVLRKGDLFVESEFLALAQALEGFHRSKHGEGIAKSEEFSRARKVIKKALTNETVEPALAERIMQCINFANQVPFRARILDLCKHFPDKLLTDMGIEANAFADAVVKMRNDWTHIGGKCKTTEEIDVKELFRLSQRIRAFLRGGMLLTLGLPANQISEAIISQAKRWS